MRDLSHLFPEELDKLLGKKVLTPYGEGEVVRLLDGEWAVEAYIPCVGFDWRICGCKLFAYLRLAGEGDYQVCTFDGKPHGLVSRFVFRCDECKYMTRI